MEGITIIETATLHALIGSVENLKLAMLTELKSSKNNWMTINEVVEFTGLSRSAVNANRPNIGYTNAGNCIRFKRSDVIEFMEQNYFKTKKRK